MNSVGQPTLGWADAEKVFHFVMHRPNGSGGLHVIGQGSQEFMDRLVPAQRHELDLSLLDGMAPADQSKTLEGFYQSIQRDDFPVYVKASSRVMSLTLSEILRAAIDRHGRKVIVVSLRGSGMSTMLVNRLTHVQLKV